MIGVEERVGLILTAGELLLTCGAEMARVEDTIERMGCAAGFTQVESYATPTGLFISLHDPAGRVYTRVKRIREGRNDIATIAAVNALSRAFSAKQMGVDEVRSALEGLQQDRAPDGLARQLIGGGGALAFAVMFGGGWREAVLAGMVGALVLMVVSRLEGRFPKVLQAAAGAMVASAVITGISRIWEFNANVTILGAVMVLAPGMVMTTAIRDLLGGELVSGLSRSAEALVIAVAIAVGVAVVLSLGGV
ncbi:threonine/serine exporter family protein [Candidatus Darwinibacter acetoxidans]|jgi:uncharacterized membrane protein YjjP (DUF1212 family)